MTGVRGATATPSDDGFYLPADDARHAQIWLPWPHEKGLQSAIAALAHVILRYEPVSLVVAPGAEAAARAACGPVSIVPVKFTSPRLRDTGPSFLVDGKGGSAAADWHFSGGEAGASRARMRPLPMNYWGTPRCGASARR